MNDIDERHYYDAFQKHAILACGCAVGCGLFVALASKDALWGLAASFGLFSLGTFMQMVGLLLCGDRARVRQIEEEHP